MPFCPKNILHAGFLVFLLAGFFYSFLFPHHRQSVVSHRERGMGDPVSSGDRAKFHNGDFILRRGNGFMSTLIIRTLGNPDGFSHAGILVRDDQDTWQVIHSVSRGLSAVDGVQQESLDSFERKSVHGSTVVVRVRCTATQRKDLVREAFTLLENACPFDRSFALGGSEIYCSELLWRVLPEEIRNASMIFEKPAGVIRFESFLDENYYDVVLDYRN